MDQQCAFPNRGRRAAGLAALWLLPLLWGAVAWGWQQQRWAWTYGESGADFATSVQRLEDGYLGAGYTNSYGSGKQDGWVWRLDEQGSSRWQKVYGGAEDDDFLAAALAADGGMVAAGSTLSFGVIGQDAWAMRLDAAGESVWQYAYGGVGNEAAQAIWPTVDGGYVLAGSSSSGSAGGADGWVWRLDAAGDIVWQFVYGGPAVDEFQAVTATTDGGFVVAGETWSFGAALSDGWLLKLDGSGGVVWQKRYGDLLADGWLALQAAADGGVIVAGYTDSVGTGGQDAWVMRLDAAGDALWQMAYGGVDADRAEALLTLADGSYLVAGVTESFGAGHEDAWVLRLDDGGKIVWQKTYGGSLAGDVASAITAAPAGGAVFAGHTFSFGAGEVDAWGVRLDGQGLADDATLGQDSWGVAVPAAIEGRPTNAAALPAAIAARSLPAQAQAVDAAAAALAPRRVIIRNALTPTPPATAISPTATASPAIAYWSLGLACLLIAWVGLRLWPGIRRRRDF